MAISLTKVDPDDPAMIDAYCRVLVAVRDHDVPLWRDTTPRMVELMIRHAIPSHRMDHYLATRDGEPVGRVTLELPSFENLDMLDADIWVVPSARRQGVGRELWEFVKASASTHNRKKIVAGTLWEMPGIVAPDKRAGIGFAESLEFKPAQVNVCRRLDLSTVDEEHLDAMLGKARAASAGYQVRSWIDIHPEEHLNDLAYLEGRLASDAPMGELDFEIPQYDVERFLAFANTFTRRERVCYHTAAVHEESGKLVSWTTISREKSLDWHGFQMITIVAPEHRGHRLGALVKVENLRHLRAHEPTVRIIDTFNAADNSYMIAINEDMGFRPLYAWQSWKREI